MAKLKATSTTGRKYILNELNFTYNLSNYPTLKDAIIAIGGEEATLYIPKGRWDASGVVVPEEVHLLFDRGGLLTGDCEVNGSIEAGMWQIFDSSNTITRATKIKLDAVYPEWFGAKGDGASPDDGVYIRKATNFIKNTVGSTIIFSGNYQVRAHENTQRITPPSHSRLDFLPGSRILVVPNSSPYYSALRIVQVEDVHVNNAVIIGDREEHQYVGGSTHEWGFGIELSGVTGEITLSNCVVKNCSGDGLYMNSINSPMNLNTLITDCTFHQNRRQGCSITAWNGVIFRNCVFSGTAGTAPQCGVDIEPNYDHNPVKDIYFYNCRFVRNLHSGLYVWLTFPMKGEVSIFIDSCFFDENYQYPIFSKMFGSQTGSASVIVKNSVALNNGHKAYLIEPDGSGVVTYFIDLYEKTSENLSFEHTLRLN